MNDNFEKHYFDFMHFFYKITEYFGTYFFESVWFQKIGSKLEHI